MQEDINFSLNINGVKESYQSVGALKTRLGELKNELETTTDKGSFQKISNEVAKGEKQLNNFTASTKGIGRGFADSVGGINIFGTSIGSLFKMILANPVGILIAALVALGSQLAKLDPVIDFIEKAMSGLSAAFDSLIGGIGGFIGALMNGDGIIDAFKNNIGNIGDKMKTAANAAWDLTAAIQALEDAENEHTVSTAKLNKEITILEAKAKSHAYTNQQRIDFLKKANELEEKDFQDSLKIAKKKEQIAKDQLKQIDDNKQNREKAAKAAAEAEAARINMEASHVALTEKWDGKISALKDQQLAEANKAEADKQALRDKELADKQKAIETDANQQRISATNTIKDEDALKKKLVNIKKQELEDKIALLRQYKQDATAIEFELAGVNRDISLSSTDDLQKELDKMDKDQTKDAKKKTSLTEKQAEEILKQKLTNEEIATLATKDSVEEQTKFLNDLAKTKMDNEGKALTEATQSFNQMSSLAEEGSGQAKAFGIAGAMINTYAAVIAAFKNTLEMGPLGVVLAPIQAGIALATGLKSVEQITAVKTPTAKKYRFGGLISGASHEMGGVDVTHEVEGGEFILNRNSMKSPVLRGVAEMINNIGNGKAFATNQSNTTYSSSPQEVFIVDKNIAKSQRRVAIKQSKRNY